MKEIKRPWSFSRYRLHDECPAKFDYSVIRKYPEPSAPALERGERIHNLARDYVMGEMPLVPPELRLYEKEMQQHRNLVSIGAGHAEQELAFDENWELTGYFDKNVYVRIKIDFVATLPGGVIQIIDYKTGRVQEKGFEPQLELYAAGAISAFDNVTKIVTSLYYIDHYVSPTRTFLASEARKLQKKWDARAVPVTTAESFEPKPGAHCRWCFFSKEKGGPCKW